MLPSEAAVLDLVASQTDIRVPRVHRAWQVDDETKYFGTMGYILMDYVDGQPLEECWERLCTEKLDIAQQVADIVSKLQSVQLPNPGPIGGGFCRGRFFTDYSAGPFENTSVMQDWFNHKLVISKAWNKRPATSPSFSLRNLSLRIRISVRAILSWTLKGKGMYGLWIGLMRVRTLARLRMSL